jgi:PAS domain S-box-containing protein
MLVTEISVILLMNEKSDILEKEAVAGDGKRSSDADAPTAAESGLLGYWEIDGATGKFHWPEETRQLHELDAADDINIDTIASFYHPDDQARAAACFLAALEDGTNFQTDLRLAATDGPQRIIRTTGIPRKSADGAIEVVSGFCQDISASSQIDQQRAIHSGILEQAEHLSNVGYWYFDEANNKLFWSEGIYRIHGLSPDTPANGKMAISHHHPDDQPIVIAHFRKHRENNENFRYELRIVRPDGEIRYVRSVGGFRLNVEGSSGYLFGLVQDITDERETRRTLQRSEAIFKSFVEQSPSAIMVKDVDGKYQTANSKWLNWFNAGDPDFEGSTIEDIASPEFAKLVNAQDRRVAESGESSETHHVLPLPDGRELTVLSQKFPIKDANGEIIGIGNQNIDLSALAKAEETQVRLQEAMESTSDGYVIYDEHRKLVYCNSQFQDFYPSVKEHLVPGTSLELIIRKAAEDGLYAGEIDDMDAWVEDMLEKYDRGTKSYTQVLDDGRVLYCSDNRSSLGGYVGTRTDITKIKQAEAELHKHQVMLQSLVDDRTRDLQTSEGRLRDLIDGSLQGILVHRDLQSLFVNDTYAAIHGYTVEEFLTLDAISDVVHPSDHARLIEYDRLRRSGGEAPLHYEYKGIRKDGSTVWLMNRSRRVNWDGQMASQNTVIDVTERKKAEEALVESERLYRIILETSPIGLGIAHTESGTAKFVNDAQLKLFGVTREEFLGKAGYSHWFDLKDRDRFFETYTETGRAEGILKLLKGDGTPFWAVQRWETSPLDKEDVLFWTYDITELKNTRDEMEKARDAANRANEAKSEFLSSMSHELRTPLNAILGFGQLMESSPDDPLSEDHMDSLGRILDGGRHLLSLVNDILDLARVESGSMAVSIAPQPVDDCIADSLQFIARDAGKRDISIINSTVELALPDVLADDVRLKQVLLNLLSNALKYNRDNGSITVAGEVTGEDMLRLSITDTGNGISPEDQLELFKPFNRLGAERTDVEGTGIGLTVTRELVTLMNGKMGLHSKVGEGSTFWFELPLA